MGEITGVIVGLAVFSAVFVAVSCFWWEHYSPIEHVECIDGKTSVMVELKTGERKLFPLPVECEK